MSLECFKISRTSNVLWFTAVALGISYWLGSLARSGLAFECLTAAPAHWVIGWKALATGCLVLSSFFAANTAVLRQFAVAIGIIWLADLLLAFGLTVQSGYVFVLAHLVSAHAFFTMRSQQKGTLLSRAVGFGILCTASAGISLALAMGAPLLFAIFPLFSAISAFLSTRSMMPLMLSSIGALIFHLSDLVAVLAIASDEGVTPWGWLVWLTYFTGLLLMSRGILVRAKQS